MIEHLSTTPFGRRGLSCAMIAGQIVAGKAAAAPSVDKWRVFRAVCEVRSALGASDRALVVLEALLSFHPQAELAADEGLIVFPSNAQLALRAHGMAPATLRRHLAVLVECGLVVRRDSPNGKRYARKGEDGGIETAFGFDLAPLLARAAEFERLAEEIRAERRAVRLLRERLTLLRRDISKMIAFALEEAVAGDWTGRQLEYRAILEQLPRNATRAALESVEASLRRLAAELRKHLEMRVNVEKPSANESHFERHIQNSKSHHLESEPRFEKKQGRPSAFNPEPARDSGEHQAPEPPMPAPEIFAQEPDREAAGAIMPELETKSAPPPAFPLGLVLRACPDIAGYARDGISGWADLVATANLVRSALGVSPDAWDQACEVMGAMDAAIAVAAILQRAEHIQSSGGYLRSLTDKARAGQFSVGPLLMSLLRAAARSEQARAG
jgi:replication initiation protein RepC